MKYILEEVEELEDEVIMIKEEVEDKNDDRIEEY